MIVRTVYLPKCRHIWSLILITVISLNIQARRSRGINSSWRTLSSSSRSVQHSALFTLRVHVFCVLLCSDNVTAISSIFWFPCCHSPAFLAVSRSSLSINALRACVYIYIRQLSSFRAPTLWFIDLTVATCHIQYTFLSLCQFFHEKSDKTRKYSKSVIVVWYENVHRRLLGAQSINTESLFQRNYLGCQTHGDRIYSNKLDTRIFKNIVEILTYEIDILMLDFTEKKNKWTVI